MKHIALVTPNFEPESNAGAKRLTALAGFLAGKGWQVTVITQLPHHPQNVVYDGYQRPTPYVVQDGALTVIRLGPWIVPKSSLPKRLLSELWFTLRAVPHLLQTRPDLILASSPYMFLGPAARLTALVMAVPFAWDVRDLTWLYPRAVGKRTYGLDSLLARLMLRTGRRANMLTATTEGQVAYFGATHGVARVVPNGVSQAAFDALASLPDPFAPGAPRTRVAYMGLFGFNHGIGTIVDAARLVPEADFVFVGDGPDRELLERAATELANVEVLPYLPFERLLDAYGSADVLVSHVRRNPVFKRVQAAKVWEYLATGRPVIHAGEGETVEALRRHDLGVTVDPEDPAALAVAIRGLMSDVAAARELGARGREYVRRSRIRDDLFAQMETDLDGLLASAPQAARD